MPGRRLAAGSRERLPHAQLEIFEDTGHLRDGRAPGPLQRRAAALRRRRDQLRQRRAGSAASARSWLLNAGPSQIAFAACGSTSERSPSARSLVVGDRHGHRDRVVAGVEGEDRRSGRGARCTRAPARRAAPGERCRPGRGSRARRPACCAALRPARSSARRAARRRPGASPAPSPMSSGLAGVRPAGERGAVRGRQAEVLVARRARAPRGRSCGYGT